MQKLTEKELKFFRGRFSRENGVIGLTNKKPPAKIMQKWVRAGLVMRISKQTYILTVSGARLAWENFADINSKEMIRDLIKKHFVKQVKYVLNEE